jgi:hypothetical protein
MQAWGADTVGDLRQRQMEFLQRLRQAEPRHESIEKAVFSAQNELGIILNRRMDLSFCTSVSTVKYLISRLFP